MEPFLQRVASGEPAAPKKLISRRPNPGCAWRLKEHDEIASFQTSRNCSFDGRQGGSVCKISCSVVEVAGGFAQISDIPCAVNFFYHTWADTSDQSTEDLMQLYLCESVFIRVMNLVYTCIGLYTPVFFGVIRLRLRLALAYLLSHFY